MAIFAPSKTAAEVVEVTFSPPLNDGDAILSFTATATGCTKDSSEDDGKTITLVISAGTAAATGSIAFSVITEGGETLAETMYIPIVNSAAQIAATARDYVEFALRRATGLGEDPTSHEADEALAILNGMVAEWRQFGADIGAPYPLTLTSVIYCPDYAVNALRYNLMMNCTSFLSFDPGPYAAERAKRGLQLVRQTNLPDERASVLYY